VKILFTADTHLGLTNHSRIIDGVNTRISEIEECFEFCVDYAIENSFDLFVHCGDLFHKAKPDINSIWFAYRQFKRLIDARIKVKVIDGNHDAASIVNSVSVVHLLNSIDDQDQIAVTGLKDQIYKINGFRINFIPYGVPLMVAKDCDIVVGHTTLEGAVSGYESMLLAKFCSTEKIPDHVTVCGHIHKAQLLRKDPFAAYPGSIIQNDFGERGELKGFLIFDSDSEKKWKYITTPYRKLVQFEQRTSFTRDEVAEKIVKVKITSEEYVDVEEIKNSLYGLGAIYVTVEFNSIKKIASRNSSMIAGNSIASLFELYCESEKETEEFKSIGREIIGTL